MKVNHQDNKRFRIRRFKLNHQFQSNIYHEIITNNVKTIHNYCRFKKHSNPLFIFAKQHLSYVIYINKNRKWMETNVVRKYLETIQSFHSFRPRIYFLKHEYSRLYFSLIHRYADTSFQTTEKDKRRFINSCLYRCTNYNVDGFGVFCYRISKCANRKCYLALFVISS